MQAVHQQSVNMWVLYDYQGTPEGRAEWQPIGKLGAAVISREGEGVHAVLTLRQLGAPTALVGQRLGLEGDALYEGGLTLEITDIRHEDAVTFYTCEVG